MTFRFRLGAGLLVCLGVVNVGNQVALYITLPVGITFLGLALICYALEKEVAQFDEDQNTRSTVVPSKSERGAAENPRDGFLECAGRAQRRRRFWKT